MENKKNSGKKLLVGVLVLLLLLAGAYMLYSRLSSGTGGLLQPAPQGGTSGQEEMTDRQETANKKDQADASAGQEEPEAEMAPDFVVYDREGEEVRLSDFRGKPVVLNFWASWCYFCKEEMPDFDELYREQGDQVHFLMVNATDGRQETKEKAETLVRENGYEFPIYFDSDESAVRTYGIRGLPATFFIDAEGRLAAVGQGALDKESVRRGIDMCTDQEKTDTEPG